VASTRVTIGKPQAAGLHLGSPLLLEARTGCSFLSAAARKGKEAFPWGDIYPYDSAQFAPVFAALPAAAPGIRVVIPCAVPGGGASDLSLRAALVDSVSGAQVPIAAAIAGRVQKGPLEILTLDLPTAGIAAGTYYLHFYAEERSTGSLGHTFVTVVVPAR